MADGPPQNVSRAPSHRMAVAGIVADETLTWRFESARDGAEIRSAYSCVRVIEMGSVGKAHGVGPKLKAESLGQLELTGQAQVHVEVSRTTELIATSVSVNSSGWNGECRRVEVVTGQVGGLAVQSSRGLPTGQAKVAD